MDGHYAGLTEYDSNVQEIADSLDEGQELVLGDYPTDLGPNPAGMSKVSQGFAITETSEHKEEAWRFIRYMVEEGAERVAGTGNYPSYKPAYNDSLIQTFIEGSGLEIDDVRVLFEDMTAVSQKPTGLGAAEYQQSMQEQTQLYFNGEKSAEDVLGQIEKITNEAIEKEVSGK